MEESKSKFEILMDNLVEILASIIDQEGILYEKSSYLCQGKYCGTG